MSDKASKVQEAVLNALKLQKEADNSSSSDSSSRPKPKKIFNFKPKFVTSTNQKMYSELFGDVPKGLVDFPVTVYQDSDWDAEVQHMIPKEDMSYYIVQAKPMYWLVYSIEYGKSAMMIGPPGTGKTEAVRYVAWKTQRPYIRINGMAGLDPSDMIGTVMATAGSTHYELMDAAIAAKYGALLAYDEPFKNSAQVNMCFQNLAEQTNPKLLLYGNPNVSERHLTPDKRFRLVLCDNVSGNGDNIDKYAATEIQDSSLLNRMNVRIHMPYLNSVTETNMISKRFKNITKSEARKMVQMAGLIRQAWDKDQLDQPYSPRNLIEWGEAYLFCGDIRTAFEMTYLSEDTSDEVKTVLNQFWKDINFEVE